MPTRDKDERPAARDSQAGKVAVESTVSEHRRKIIKASAAVVPAIMTLRSGAAAAMTSSANRCLNKDDTPINTTSDVGGIDPVLGDYEPARPLDEWLRVVSWSFFKCMYATGNSAEKPYFLIRKDNSSLGWPDLEGWDIRDMNGDLRDNLRKKDDFITAWNNRVAMYAVDSYPDGMKFIGESGAAVTVPEAVSSYIKISTTQTYSLAYYKEGDITIYPMPQGDALLITGSCLCSINPTFQL